MWQKPAGEVWLEKSISGASSGGIQLSSGSSVSLCFPDTMMRQAALFCHALPRDALLHPRPRIRWPWAGNLWNREPKPIVLHFKLSQLFAELCLTIHCLPQRVYCFQRLCVPCIFYFSLLGLCLFYFGGQALPSVFAMCTYFRVLFMSWLNSHFPVHFSPCGFSINLSSFCYVIPDVYAGLSHEAMSISFWGLVFLSLCNAEHRPDSWNFRNKFPLRERVE